MLPFPKRRKYLSEVGGSGEPDDLASLKYQTDEASTFTEYSTEDADDSSEDDSVDKYEWEREKQRKIQFFDDGTMSYFWRAHTFTVLLIMIAVLVYVSIFEEPMDDSEYNAKRGMIACILIFTLMGVSVIPDGPFLRPHPALWRLLFCLSIVYELALIFVLFQSATEARLLLRHVDPTLGTLLEEKSYGGNCLIYDPEVPDDPFHNIWDKVDLFVPTHFFGWWAKTIILRDWWLCTVISVMFEILEYTLEHQLPNFSECWWDHWIMDALLCNGLGIYIGIKTLRYFQVKTYYWRGLWSIPGYKAKLRRIFGQFGPHTWIEFDWRSTSSFGRWIAVLGIIFVFLFAELNTFYLKFVLWVPHGHWLNLSRLIFLLFVGAVALRETFQFLDDPDCKTFGRQSWIVLAIISTEFLIVAKFDPVTITKPIPKHISLFWLFGIGALMLWTTLIILRGLRRRSKHPVPVGSLVHPVKSENNILHLIDKRSSISPSRDGQGSRARKSFSTSSGISEYSVPLSPKKKF